jgi:hypothetical protein
VLVSAASSVIAWGAPRSACVRSNRSRIARIRVTAPALRAAHRVCVRLVVAAP